MALSVIAVSSLVDPLRIAGTRYDRLRPRRAQRI